MEAHTEAPDFSRGKVGFTAHLKNKPARSALLAARSAVVESAGRNDKTAPTNTSHLDQRESQAKLSAARAVPPSAQESTFTARS